jgi:hypothetical protein
MARTDVVAQELSRIKSRHKGLLKAEDVVRAARPTTSPLHSRFLWDNSKAGHQYRLEQARHLIAVTVIIDGDEKKPMFVSLSIDRTKRGGGYRQVVDVLSDKRLTAQLLADAKREMQYFIEKYQKLTALAKVVRAMKQVLKK